MRELEREFCPFLGERRGERWVYILGKLDGLIGCTIADYWCYREV